MLLEIFRYYFKLKMYHNYAIWKFLALDHNSHFFDDIEDAYDLLVANEHGQMHYNVTCEVISILVNHPTIKRMGKKDKS